MMEILTRRIKTRPAVSAIALCVRVALDPLVLAAGTVLEGSHKPPGIRVEIPSSPFC